jgi:hypothetical protein
LSPDFFSFTALLSLIAFLKAVGSVILRYSLRLALVSGISFLQLVRLQLISQTIVFANIWGRWGPRRASTLGSRYLLKHLSAEVNPAKGSCTQLYSPRLLARARVLERALLVLPGPFQQLTPPF